MFGHFDEELTEHLFLAMQYNSSLKFLDLRCFRHIHSWNRTSKSSKIDQKTEGYCIARLVESLLVSKSDISLDLSGNRLSRDSALKLAKSLPQLELKELVLRDTDMDEVVMLELLQSLKSATCSVRELDLSHNSFSSMKLMRELIEALEINTMLNRLTMDHCDIDFDQIQLFAQSMVNIQGLRHLSMNGNPFTWYPILNGVYRDNMQLVKGYLAPDASSWPESRGTVKDDNYCDDGTPSDSTGIISNNKYSSFGLVILLKYLEQPNSMRLLTLEAGDHKDLDGCWGIVCCSTPHYRFHLTPSLKERLQRCLRRNQKIYDAFRKTRR